MLIEYQTTTPYLPPFYPEWSVVLQVTQILSAKLFLILNPHFSSMFCPSFLPSLVRRLSSIHPRCLLPPLLPRRSLGPSPTTDGKTRRPFPLLSADKFRESHSCSTVIIIIHSSIDIYPPKGTNYTLPVRSCLAPLAPTHPGHIKLTQLTSTFSDAATAAALWRLVYKKTCLPNYYYYYCIRSPPNVLAASVAATNTSAPTTLSSTSSSGH